MNWGGDGSPPGLRHWSKLVSLQKRGFKKLMLTVTDDYLMLKTECLRDSFDEIFYRIVPAVIQT